MTTNGTGAGPISNGASGMVTVGGDVVSESNKSRGRKPKYAAPCARLVSTGSAHLMRRLSLPAILRFVRAVARFTWPGKYPGNEAVGRHSMPGYVILPNPMPRRKKNER